MAALPRQAGVTLSADSLRGAKVEQKGEEEKFPVWVERKHPSSPVRGHPSSRLYGCPTQTPATSRFSDLQSQMEKQHRLLVLQLVGGRSRDFRASVVTQAHLLFSVSVCALPGSSLCRALTNAPGGKTAPKLPSLPIGRESALSLTSNFI